MAPRATELPSPSDIEAALAIPTYDAPPWNVLSEPSNSFCSFIEGWRDCTESPCEQGPRCTGASGPHNLVHVWVGGVFGDPKNEILGTMSGITAPNDPVFWLHHANIDRIWIEWQRRHGRSYLPLAGGHYGQNLDGLMWPFHTIGINVTPRSLLDHHALGYTYDEGEPRPAPVQLPKA